MICPSEYVYASNVDPVEPRVSTLGVKSGVIVE